MAALEMDPPALHDMASALDGVASALEDVRRLAESAVTWATRCGVAGLEDGA